MIDHHHPEYWRDQSKAWRKRLRWSWVLLGLTFLTASWIASIGATALFVFSLVPVVLSGLSITLASPWPKRCLEMAEELEERP